MNRKTKKELKAFKEFKKKYKFVQKEIIEDGETLYCGGEIVKQGEEVVAFSEKWINVGFKLKGIYSKAISNLFPYEIVFRGKKMKSLECFFQGIKFKDKKTQNLIFEYSEMPAVYIKIANDYDWKETGIVYWQGKPIKRDSKEYDDMVDELYISALQNPLYRNVLRNCDKDIIHSIGLESKDETVFTRYEFEHQLNCLMAFVKNEGDKNE